MQVREWKILNFDKKKNHYLTEECYWSPNWQYPNIALDDGLAPNRRQAIIWSNIDPIHCRIYAALGADGLHRFISRVWMSISNDWTALFCTQDLGGIVYNPPNIIAAEMAALYPPGSRDLEIIDVCAGTGLVGQKVGYRVLIAEFC